jgi:hypothetical protein
MQGEKREDGSKLHTVNRRRTLRGRAYQQKQAADTMRALLDVAGAAQCVAECEGQTLIGCAPESEYDPVTTPSNEQRAHEYGAYKAFNQCAGMIKPALAKLQEQKDDG